MEDNTWGLAEETHALKYRQVGEDFPAAMSRIARHLADDEQHYKAFRDILVDRRFLPGGRVQSASGATRQVTAFNCFTGDTTVVTDKGVKTLFELAQEGSATILTGEGKYQTAPVYSHGTQRIYGVLLQNGHKKETLFATPDHEWIVVNKEERLKTTDLKKGMKIPHGEFKPSQDDMWAVAHGLIYGDGSRSIKDGATKGYYIHVCSEHEITYRVLEGIPYSESDRGRFYYFFGENSKCDMKSLPLEPTPEYVHSFLKGLFLADGSVSKQPEVMITGTEELWGWVNKYGPMAGWYPVGRSKLSEETNYGFRTRPTYNIRFDLRTMGASKLLKGNLDYTPRSEGWRVVEIWEEGEAQVYCPSIEGPRSFISGKGIVLGQCYVMDKIPDSLEGIMRVLTEASKTMQMGGGVGYDFSTLRPRGALIKSLQSFSSGPLSFMDIFDAMCAAISSAGHRRGAQMATMRVDHPDIEDFITSKTNTTRFRNFNISVLVTDKFMKAVEDHDNFDLVFEGQVYKTVYAPALWDRIMRSTWDYAEPGVIFIDRVNRKNNLWYCETIAATNPCGEQPLPPYGACLLGSFNLTAYMKTALFVGEDKLEIKPIVDLAQLRMDIPVVVRAMDNIIDRTIYPLPRQEEEAKAKRRMGLGFTGMANALEVMGLPYGSPEFLAEAEKCFTVLRDQSYIASIELAKEKGRFPRFNSLLLESEFARTLSEDIQSAIRVYGLRNSHLLSMAPTGTISLTAGNISSSIEPPFLHYYDRTVREFDKVKTERISDYAYREWGIKGKTALELTPEEHVAVLNLASRYVDSACSKTCNIGDDVTWEQFQNVYKLAYEGGASGCTTYRAAGKITGVLTAPDIQEDQLSTACTWDPDTGKRTCE